MNELMKLSREAQIILGCAVLYVIMSFLDWQQVCASGGGISVCGGTSEWHGVGLIAALLAVALLVWEVARLLGRKIPIGDFAPELISVALAIALLVFTVITFLSFNEFRHWPQWVGLILAIVIAIVAVQRGRSEGVEMPKMPASIGSGGGSSSSGGGSTAGPTSTDAGPSTPAAAPSDEGGERPQAT
jgi:hypothetical protein